MTQEHPSKEAVIEQAIRKACENHIIKIADHDVGILVRAIAHSLYLNGELSTDPKDER